MRTVDIAFARGDSHERGFLLKNKTTGQPITTEFDEVYFTVKKFHTDDDFLFQKRMTTGGIQDDGNGHYTLYIMPDDTNGLAFGKYDCDIEFRKGTTYKRTFPGTLYLLTETTHQINE